MGEKVGKGSQEARDARNQDDGAPVVLQNLANVAQCAQVIRQMLNHVQANDGVKLLFLGIRVPQLPVRVANTEVRPIPANVFEVRQVQRIYVACPVELARSYLQSQIACSRPYFQYFLAHVRTADI